MIQRRWVLVCAIVATCVASSVVLSEDKLKVGDAAPDFILPSATKDSVNYTGLKLSEVVGKSNIVLAFYPADWSGGCTKEMCTMRDDFSSLSGLGATIFGISGDYVYSHREWAKYLNLQFALLSDHSHDVARSYQSYNPESGFNMRTVYVVDRKGNIAYMDLAYKAGSPESFQRLKDALVKLK
jgi:peroxiredoxin